MNWEECVKNWNIGRMYQNATLERVKNIHPHLAKLGETWLAKSGRPPLFLSGSPGSGKTFFMISLVRHLVIQAEEKSENHGVIYISSLDLDNELLDASLEHQEKFKLNKYCEVPLLFIDDLGVERDAARTIKQYYAIIDARMNNYRCTVFTSNLSLETIGINLGDRIASRLNFFTEIKFPSRDLRKENSGNFFKEGIL